MDPASRATDISVIRFSSVDSTSLYARRVFESGQLAGRTLMVLAETQSGAIGRFKRSWDSPRGGLWCTLAHPIEQGGPGDRVIEGLGLRVGLAATCVIAALLAAGEPEASVRMKWPNDVLIDGRKVCGILSEVLNRQTPSGPERCVLVGVGLNVNLNVRDLRPDLRDRATTIRSHLGHDLDLEHVRMRLTYALVGALGERGISAATLAAARERLHGVDQPVTITLPGGGRLSGVFAGLDEHGLALVRSDAGLVHAPPGSMIMED